MNRIRVGIFAACGLVALLLATSPVQANDLVAQVNAGTTQISFAPQVQYDQITLRVSGPAGTWTETFGAGDAPVLSLFDAAGQYLADGSYTWELVVTPHLSQDLKDAMAEARDLGDDSYGEVLRSQGFLPERMVQSGSIWVQQGAFVSADQEEAVNPAPAVKSTAASTGSSEGPTLATRDNVILDDLIVDGSACIGMDCANGESFGFDTLRLKENKLRIKFDDTSASASFPGNDWQLTANDSDNGGANKFSIDDTTNSKTPFTVEANSPSNTLYVASEGRIGVKTSTPVVDIHVVQGNTPTLRLEQDGSSGFTPHTWDLAGNETNFFLRDVTGGSKLPFRVKPGAEDDSVFIAANSNVGIGTDSPDAKLDVEGGDILINRPNATAETAQLEIKNSVGAWTFETRTNGNLVIAGGANPAVAAFVMNTGPQKANNFFMQNGSVGIGTSTPIFSATDYILDVNGKIYQRGVSLHADYVFEPDYELESIAEHAEFMWEAKHLPAVPPRTVDADGLEVIETGSHRQGMLEELEKAHIYIAQLHDELQTLKGQSETKDNILSELLTRIDTLEESLR